MYFKIRTKQHVKKHFFEITIIRNKYVDFFIICPYNKYNYYIFFTVLKHNVVLSLDMEKITSILYFELMCICGILSCYFIDSENVIERKRIYIIDFIKKKINLVFVY